MTASSTSSTKSSTQATTTDTTTAAPSPSTVESSASSPSPQAASSGGLSVGAKAGIGVGVALGGLGFLLGAVALFLMLRKNKKRNEKDLPGELATAGQEVHEVPLEKTVYMLQADAHHQPVQLEVPPAELPGDSGMVEMDAAKVNGQAPLR